MNTGKTLLAPVMEFIPWTSFSRIVQRHRGNVCMRSLSCAEQFRAMAFAQLTWRESLRDIEASLSANVTKALRDGFSLGGQALHTGRRQPIARLAHLVGLGRAVIRRARTLYASEPLSVEGEMDIDDPAGSESKRSVIGPATPAMADSEEDFRRPVVCCLTPCDAHVPTCVVESSRPLFC